MSNIELGQSVKDSVTGFQGVVTQILEHLSGNVQFAIQPKSKDPGVFPDAIFIDGHTLKVVKGPAITVTPAPNTDIKVGWKVRDKATGLEGIATSKSIHINGCVFFLVLPNVKKDSLFHENPKGDWVNYVRLEKVDDGLIKTTKPASQSRPGGPSTRTHASRAPRCA